MTQKNMRLWLQLSRMTGPIFMGIPLMTVQWLADAGVGVMPIACGMSLWSFCIGYIARGWTEYLNSINDRIDG